jgi:cytochrome P450
MSHILFLQSEVANPFGLYSRLLYEQPVHWDETHQVWAVHTYRDYLELLHSPAAHIPSQDSTVRAGMGTETARVAERLTRLSNPPHHALLRKVAVRLFEKMEPVSTYSLLESLLGKPKGAKEIDWVQTVAKQLPVLSVLKGFGFSAENVEAILPQVEKLTKMMVPRPTDEQIVALQEAIAIVYPLIEQHLLTKPSLRGLLDTHANATDDYEETVLLYISNLIGLLIQSYDAGRGALSNALLQLLTHNQTDDIHPHNASFFQRSVIETLRYDPSVHHTRRVLTEDYQLSGKVIKKGEAVLLVLAAANRDQLQFKSANEYSIFRPNNADFLTFGAGSHQCLAKYFTIQLVSEVLQALFIRYPSVRLRETVLSYEPLANVRLLTRMTLAIS